MTDKRLLNDLVKHPHLISKLHFEDISEIIKSVYNIFRNENLLLDFNLNDNKEKVYIIGDIHGNLESLLKIVELIEKNNPLFVIFLGDIVDRGSKQLECLIVILALKQLYPLKFFILKGNHETLEMNRVYGFFKEFTQKFNDQNLFNEILMIYDSLPICAIIDNIILCLHGGIPQDLDILKKLKDIRIKDSKTTLNLNSESIFQIMWNDPESEILGYTESYRGPGIKSFGEDVFNEFMRFNKLKYLIRAHECFPEGFRWFFNKRLLSIFSSANYRGINAPNPASYAIIRDKMVIPKLIEFS